MRNVILHINVSLNGMIENSQKEIDWHFVDHEFELYINDLLGSIGGMIFGRKAHQVLGEYWPTARNNPNVSAEHLAAAYLMNALPKYVISKGEYSSSWENSFILRHNLPEAIKTLKETPGLDLVFFAGANAAQTLSNLGLIDEYRFVINPILIQDGTPLFQQCAAPLKLDLCHVRTFKSGAAVLNYRPETVAV